MLFTVYRDLCPVQGCWVDLTARPLCSESDPDLIIDLQRRLQEEGDQSPVLQAVYVGVKRSAESCLPPSLPRPTPLRACPGHFHTGPTCFYLDPSLGARLDIKVARLLEYTGADSLPFPCRGQAGAGAGEEELVREISSLDSHRSHKFLFGILPDVQRLSAEVTLFLPSRVECRVVPVFLHRTGFRSQCGLVELTVQLEGRRARESVTALGYFSLDRYKFWQGQDWFSEDLANVSPLSRPTHLWAVLEGA